MLTLPDLLTSRYLTYRGLRDAGIDAGKACVITDLIHGPEPAEDHVCHAAQLIEPDDEVYPALQWSPYIPDAAEYEWWLDQLDKVQAIQALHDRDEQADRINATAKFHVH